MYYKDGKNIIMMENTIKFNVQETFQSTLQGEGYNSGRVCDFIRLYGCPVGCFFCDNFITFYKSLFINPKNNCFI